MRWMLGMAFVSIMFVSCKSAGNLPQSNNKQVEIESETYQIMVQFKNPEGLKRVLYRLDKFKIQMEEEVSNSDFIYKMRLDTKPYEIDGIVEKLRLNEDVLWAKRVAE